jgi:hypothetical protein
VLEASTKPICLDKLASYGGLGFNRKYRLLSGLEHGQSWLEKATIQVEPTSSKLSFILGTLKKGALRALPEILDS